MAPVVKMLGGWVKGIGRCGLLVSCLGLAETARAEVGLAEPVNAAIAVLDPRLDSNELGHASENLLGADPVAPMAQVTPVTQLIEFRDVQPTDWAFTALQSLIAQYGGLIGYPDRTFRGNQPVTRDEFAAALSLFVQRLDRLSAEQSASILQEGDWLTLQRLQREYGSALASLGERLNDIGDRVGALEAQQFSATSQLQSEVILAPSIGSNAGLTLLSRVRLNVLTQLTPSDRLVTQLEMGNGEIDAIGRVHRQPINFLGTAGQLADGGGTDYAGVSPTVQLQRLAYSFQPYPNLEVTVGPKLKPRDFIDRNRFANDSTRDFNSSFFLNNPLIVQNAIDRPGGAGAAVQWQPEGGAWAVRSLYVAADAHQPRPTMQQGGLFGSSYQGTVEVEYAPNPTFAVRLQYTNAAIADTRIQAGGINLEWALNRHLGFFGRYGFGSYQGVQPILGTPSHLYPHSWALGVALQDWGIPGTLAGLALGQPFVESRLGNATQTNLEAFYNLWLSDNISVTPALTVVTNANNNSTNGWIWQGTFRTVFLF